jgi:CheY-like chemotaxis protein
LPVDARTTDRPMAVPLDGDGHRASERLSQKVVIGGPETWRTRQSAAACFVPVHAGMMTGARVLVADDDPELLAVVADALAFLGLDVVRAQSGAELIEQLAEEGPFDLVVTDVSMPWMNGLQAMHSARTAGLGTSVIVMTALLDSRIPMQVQALGRHAALLRKPFTLSELGSLAMAMLSETREPRHQADSERSAPSSSQPTS